MIKQGVPSCDSARDSQHQSPQVASIHTFSDDLLLKILYRCRPVLLGKDGTQADNHHILEGGKWDSERWWYKLTKVCRKWRHLVLASASDLGLSLVCSYGMPIADMLTHTPSLPLIIDYEDEGREVTPEDEDGILLALRHRRQVSRIRFCMPGSNLRKLLAAIDGEFPMLEYLYVKPPTDDDNDIPFPETFKAPHLHHFGLRNITYTPGMFPPLPNTSFQSAKKLSEPAQCRGPQPRTVLKTPMDILDDDSLLCIFYLCRPTLLDEDEVDNATILEGGDWARERWWYKLVKVCRRWRYLMFASASYLGLNLLCTYGTPVQDMLAHSPPLPLILDYLDEYHNITAEDEEEVICALKHPERVRRIRLFMPVPKLQKLVSAVDEEFPILEYLYIEPPIKHSSGLSLPHTFKAPCLRHVILYTFAFPTRSPLITTTVGLVMLSIQDIHPSTYLRPHELLQHLPLLLQLETLGISFFSPFPSSEVDVQLLHQQNMTDVTLPNLRWFGFRGVNTYLEALLLRMTTPLLEKLQVLFFHQHNFSVPHLLQFMGAAKNLRFRSAKFQFSSNYFYVYVYPREGAPMYSLYMDISDIHLHWQVVSATQIFYQLRTVFSGLEHLALEFRRSSASSEMNDDFDHTNWGELLKPFRNVKTLRLDDELVGPLSRSLQEGELPTELLPELNKLEYPGPENLFSAFIDTRKNSGHHITVVHL